MWPSYIAVTKYHIKNMGRFKTWSCKISDVRISKDFFSCFPEGIQDSRVIGDSLVYPLHKLYLLPLSTASSTFSHVAL